VIRGGFDTQIRERNRQLTPLLPPQLDAVVNQTAKISKIRRTIMTAEPSGDTPIRPFKFQASDEDLVDLKRRIAATKWPERETVSDATQGVNLMTMQKLAEYWQTEL
jgi:hypothetical protein